MGKDRKCAKDRSRSKDTNLSHVGEELLQILKIQMGTRKLLLDKLPDPLKRSRKGNIRAFRSITRRPASEQRNALPRFVVRIQLANDNRPRIAVIRETPALNKFVRDNRYFERL